MTNRFKILGLSELYLPQKGGHTIWFHKILDNIGSSAVLTGLFAGQSATDRLNSVAVFRVRLERYPFLRPESAGVYFGLIKRGVRLVKACRPDVILCARPLPEGLAAIAIGALTKTPVVIFVHGEEVNRVRHDKTPPQRRRLTWCAKRAMMWWIVKHVDHIIANSSFTSGVLLAEGAAPDRLTVVYPGTDPNEFRPLGKDIDLLRKFGLTGSPVILTVGRLVLRKGHDQVIRALPVLVRKNPGIQYAIAGTGETEEFLRNLASDLGVTEHVVFLGYVPDELLPALYNLADVFVMPNRTLEPSLDTEGFGIVFLEANGCGKPVIGGRSGGVTDAVNAKGGFLVDGNSVDDITRVLSNLLTNSELRARLGREGRERVLTEFTWQHSAQKIEQILDSLRTRPHRLAFPVYRTAYWK